MMHERSFTDHRAEEMQDVEDYESDYYDSQPGDVISSTTNHQRTSNKKTAALTLLSVGTLMILGGIGFAMLGKEEEIASKQQRMHDSFPTQTPSLMVSPTNPLASGSKAKPDGKTEQPSEAPGTLGPTHSSMYGFVASMVGELPLMDETSLAFQGLQFLEETYDESRFGNQRLKQRFALACVHLATNQDSTWLKDDGWMTQQDECTWYGIKCKNHKVVSLNLTANGLQGLIPWEITLLKEHLVALELSSNELLNQGSELAWMGELSLLRLLDVEQTLFSFNGIPHYLSKLTGLKILDISETLFVGELDGSIFSPLTELVCLEMGGNLYNSTMPSEIAALPSLEALYVYETGMKGNVDFLTGLKKIVEIWVDDNPMLEGTIPTQIGLLTHMASLSLTNCNLFGQLPTEIGKLTMMEQMWFYGNWFSGTIPSDFAALPKLQILGLEDNNITDAAMPSELCAKELFSLTADCGGEFNFVDCDCCTCCEAPCPVVNLPTYDSGRLLEVEKEIRRL